VYAEVTGGAARVGFNGTVWSNTGTTLGVTVNGRDCTDSELNDHHFQNIAGIANGEWALYRGVDFGTRTGRQFVARVAGGAAGGVSGLVEVRVGSPTAAPVGRAGGPCRPTSPA
jgi:hypothetical protein